MNINRIQQQSPIKGDSGVLNDSFSNESPLQEHLQTSIANVGIAAKSFGSLLNSPYRIPWLKGLESERSVESPYTSLGSGQSSYASIQTTDNGYKATNNGYKALKARAAQATEGHETKSKAVMEALQSLQKKIKSLESDRTRAENNLKSLATETNDYKQLLREKQVLDKSVSAPDDTHSRELENQLEHAQNKCEILEKQLEYMRQMIKNNQVQTSPRPTHSPLAGISATKQTFSPPTSPRMTTQSPILSTYPVSSSLTSQHGQITSQSSPLPAFQQQQPTAFQQQQPTTQYTQSYQTPYPFQPIVTNAHQSTVPFNSYESHKQSMAMSTESPAFMKLNDLERQHRILTESQSLAENKIRELEEKIETETHYRKLLQDKQSKLQQAVTGKSVAKLQQEVLETARDRDEVEEYIPYRKEVKRKTKNKKKTRQRTSTKQESRKECFHPSPRSPRDPSSPSHYLMDLQSIPFVVGQSTGRSYSLGANVQNVLSIMKSHNNLCTATKTATHSTNPSKIRHHSTRQTKIISSEDRDMRELLTNLQDEFAKLGFEHHNISSDLQKVEDEQHKEDLERELDHVVYRMEQKGKQIQTIRDHLNDTPNKENKPKTSKKRNNKTVRINPNEFEIVTTVRTKGNTPKPRVVSAIASNPNLDMFKKLKKLQCTLRKDDLKWE